MTRRETRRKTRVETREAAGDTAVVKTVAPVNSKNHGSEPPTPKPAPLPLNQDFSGPGVPYQHKFTTVSRGPVGLATLNGTIAAELVCWEYFYGKECVLAGEVRGEVVEVTEAVVRDASVASPSSSSPQKAHPKNHVPNPTCQKCHTLGTADDTCRGRVREALGQVRPKRGVKARGGDSEKFQVCRYGARCLREHPSDLTVRERIERWWRTSAGSICTEHTDTTGTHLPYGTVTCTTTLSTTSAATPSTLNTHTKQKMVWSVAGSGFDNFREKDGKGRASLTSKNVDNNVETNCSIGNTETEPSEELLEDQRERHALAVSRLKKRLQSKAETSTYVATFLSEPFFEALIVKNYALVKVLSHKSAHKEITEAYGAAGKIKETLRGVTKVDTDGTRLNTHRVTIFDACSGRGIIGVLLSFLFPNFSIVLMDADGSMDLTHVSSIKNVEFKHVDLYGDSVVAAIRDTVEEEDLKDSMEQPGTDVKSKRLRLLLGVHLCGALSPRLIDLCFGLDDVDAMVLCPCCIKGGLGGDCRRVGKERDVSPYVVLCETLTRVCEDGDVPDSTSRKLVTAKADPHVLSPVNCFICVAKN